MTKIMYRGIQQTKDTMNGKARIKDRRVTVQLVIMRLQSGVTLEKVADEYNLSDQQVKDAIGYALKCVKHFDDEKQAEIEHSKFLQTTDMIVDMPYEMKNNPKW